MNCPVGDLRTFDVLIMYTWETSPPVQALSFPDLRQACYKLISVKRVEWVMGNKKNHNNNKKTTKVSVHYASPIVLSPLCLYNHPLQ